MSIFSKIKNKVVDLCGKLNDIIDDEIEYRIDKKNLKTDYKSIIEAEKRADKIFLTRNADILLACKRNELAGREQELIDILFNTKLIDTTDISDELSAKIFKMCSKNTDLIRYICKTRNCSPEQICFNNLHPQEGQTIFFGNYDYIDKHRPTYIYGSASIGPSLCYGDNEVLADIEYVGGDLIASSLCENCTFKDLKYVGGNMFVSLGKFSAPKLEYIGGVANISDLSTKDEDYPSLKTIGRKIIYPVTWKKAPQEWIDAWSEFSEERGYKIMEKLSDREYSKLLNKPEMYKIYSEVEEKYKDKYIRLKDDKDEEESERQ